MGELERALVREARFSDAPQIARVHVDAWRTTYAGIVPEDFLTRLSYKDHETRWQSWMDRSDGRACFYAAELKLGRIVGFASGGPRRGEGYPEYAGELCAAYVLLGHQRRGLGRRLLGTVARDLASRGRRSMLAWVLAENPSRTFYEAIGGKVLGSQEVDVGGAVLEEVAYGWDDTSYMITH